MSNIAYWGKKSKNIKAFGKNTLKTSLKHLIQNYYFIVGNSLLRQRIGVPMGTDSALFWENLFLYTYENKCMSELISDHKIKAHHFHATKLFIMILVP